jgi:hypothetical protein
MALDQVAVNPGVVYILRNNSYRETIVKVGRTTRAAELRASELSRPTGIATPFEVLYEEAVADCERAEQIVHGRLSKWRVNESREFFDVPLKDAVRAVFEACLEVNEQFLRERSRLAIWTEPGVPLGNGLAEILNSATPGTTAVRLVLNSPNAVAELHLCNTLLVACTPEFLANLQRQKWVKYVQVYVPANI